MLERFFNVVGLHENTANKTDISLIMLICLCKFNNHKYIYFLGTFFNNVCLLAIPVLCMNLMSPYHNY